MRFVMAIAVACTAACGGHADAGPAPIRTFPYPLEDELRVNHVQMKATHNSYHVADPSNGDPSVQFTQPPLDEQLASGVRGFELDVHLTSEGTFRVYHTGLDQKSTCDPFAACLDVLRRWSEQHPAHHPLVVQIEPKDAEAPDRIDDYVSKLDAAIRAGIPRERLLVPDDVKGTAATLRDAITGGGGGGGGGWPTLRKARAKILFFAINTSVFRQAYTHGGTSLDGRAMFHQSEANDPYAAIMLRDDPVANGAEISDLVRRGFMVRTRADSELVEAKANDHTRADAALASGAQLVATDFPAPVAGYDYVVDVPGGTPSRCDPLSAPPDCRPDAIESPTFLAQGP